MKLPTFVSTIVAGGCALAILAAGGCASSSAAECDTSTEAGIAAAYHKATGKDLPKENRCARASTTFPGLVWMGMFANDRGCIGHGILVGCKINPAGFEAAAMAKAGWDKADLAKRQQLATAWLSEIDDLSIVGAKPDKFPKAFSPTSAKADGKTVVLEFWTVDPSGMEPVSVYRKHEVVFAADGTHGEMTESDKVELRLH